MLRTAKQAQDTLCPIMSTASMLLAPENCRTIACMGWRWADPNKNPASLDPGAIDPERRGYCGAVGKPEVET